MKREKNVAENYEQLKIFVGESTHVAQGEMQRECWARMSQVSESMSRKSVEFTRFSFCAIQKITRGVELPLSCEECSLSKWNIQTFLRLEIFIGCRMRFFIFLFLLLASVRPADVCSHARHSHSWADESWEIINFLIESEIENISRSRWVIQTWTHADWTSDPVCVQSFCLFVEK